MYIQTPKRPVLPGTPSAYGSKTVLPPLSSILQTKRPEYHNGDTFNIPSVESYDATPTVSKVVHKLNEESDPTPQMNRTFTTIPSKRSSPSENISTSPELQKASSNDQYQEIVNNSPTSSPAKLEVSKTKLETNESKKPGVKDSSLDSKAFAFISHSPATFPSKEPSIDNVPLARRKRRRTSPNQLSILNSEFELGSTPNKTRRAEIASKLSMSEKAVQIWFQNKRQSIRKQSSFEKEVTVLPPTPPVSAIVSSTPVKPGLGKSQSFISSPSVAKTTSPVNRRSNSIPLFSNANSSIVTPLANKMEKQVVTPNSSFANEESNSSFDYNSTLILNETRKKQPEFLNSTSSSTMTFKLTPASRSPFAPKVTQQLNSVLDKENFESKTNIHSILNDGTTPRKPLGLLTTNPNFHSNKMSANASKIDKKPNENECVENLLSLRSGNWK